MRVEGDCGSTPSKPEIGDACTSRFWPYRESAATAPSVKYRHLWRIRGFKRRAASHGCATREIVSSDVVEDRGSSCGYVGEAGVEPYSHVPTGEIKADAADRDMLRTGHNSADRIVDDTPVTPFELFAIRSTPCIWRTSDGGLCIPIEPTSERHE